MKSFLENLFSHLSPALLIMLTHTIRMYILLSFLKLTTHTAYNKSVTPYHSHVCIAILVHTADPHLPATLHTARMFISLSLLVAPTHPACNYICSLTPPVCTSCYLCWYRQPSTLRNALHHLHILRHLFSYGRPPACYIWVRHCRTRSYVFADIVNLAHIVLYNGASFICTASYIHASITCSPCHSCLTCHLSRTSTHLSALLACSAPGGCASLFRKHFLFMHCLLSCLFTLADFANTLSHLLNNWHYLLIFFYDGASLP